MGAHGKVSKTAAFSPQERGEKRGWEIIRAWSENAATVEDVYKRQIIPCAAYLADVAAGRSRRGRGIAAVLVMLMLAV